MSLVDLQKHSMMTAERPAWVRGIPLMIYEDHVKAQAELNAHLDTHGPVWDLHQGPCPECIRLTSADEDAYEAWLLVAALHEDGTP